YHSQHAECRGIIWLAIYSLLLFGAGGRESSTRFRLVLRHPCNQSLTEVASQLDGIVTEEIVAQRIESGFGCCGIALCQGTDQPGIGNALDCFGIFAANF